MTALNMFDLNDLLVKAGLDLASTLVMRHCPREPKLRKVLPWLAQDRHELFNAYQSQHGSRTAAALQRAKHVVSMIADGPGRALLVGVYRVAGMGRFSVEDFWRRSEFSVLRDYDFCGPGESDQALVFDLRRLESFEPLKGRLVVEWPGREVSWYRWAHRNAFEILAIHDENSLAPPMPASHDLIVDWRDLAVLPSSWRVALQQWRGIYFVFDRHVKKGYVGSASGQDNLIGRWSDYAATGHGDNKLLRASNPEDLVFSILQLVAQDTPPKELIAIESTWKNRLHTRAPYGLNDN